MFIIIGMTFGAFFFWRLVGAKLVARNRTASGALWQMAAVIAFLAGALVGLRQTDALPPLLPVFPLLSFLLVTAVVPVLCGAVTGFAVWGVVALLPVAPPTRAQRTAANNPFDGPPA